MYNWEFDQLSTVKALGKFPTMENSNRPFHEIVQARLEELGENPFSIASKTGLSYDKIRNVIRNDSRRADPKVETAREICAALDLELYIGPRRETGPVEQILLNGSDYAHIPLHKALLAAGAGASNSAAADQIIDHVAFRLDWLKRIGVTASSARLARLSGDSMAPTMWDKDLMLINTAANVPPIRKRDAKDQRRCPIYALIDHGEARVKRIERPSDDLMLLLSDNPDYPPEARQGHELLGINIVGKVMWWDHIATEH